MTIRLKKTRAVARILPAVLLVALLQACGGGGGDSDDDTRTSYLDEFLGDWKTPEVAECFAFDDSNTVYFKENLTLNLTPDTAKFTLYSYANSTCTQNEIAIHLNYDLKTSQISLPNRDNVIRVERTYRSIEATQNGTSVAVPLTTQQIADTEWTENWKDIADVSSGRLYFGDESQRGSDGYPTTIDTSYYLVR